VIFGELRSLADVSIRVPEDDVDRIQDLHAPICHALAHALEVEFFAVEPAGSSEGRATLHAD